MRLLPHVRRAEVGQCAALLRVYMARQVAQVDDTAVRARDNATRHDGVRTPNRALPCLLLFVWPIERGRYRSAADQPL